jgi:hypothetical protein
MRQPNPKVEIASGEYDRRKRAGIREPGIELVARMFNLRPEQLKNYRANYLARKKRNHENS